MSKNYLAIEIGGTKLQFMAGSDDGSPGHLIQRHVDRKLGAEGIRRQIKSELPSLMKQWKPAGVGVGFGGPVDYQTGRVARSHQIEGWSEFDLAGWIREQTGIPVWIDNDANLAALGEALRGAGRGSDPVFYVTLGSGVGGGLIRGGSVYHGAKPGESEIGHIRLDRSGVIVEHRCSGWAVDGKIAKEAAANPDGMLARLCKGMTQGHARVLPAALEANDTAAWAILRETAEDLAFALSHVTQLLHPEVVVLGGGLSLVGEPLRKSVAEALPRWVMGVFGGGPTIRLAALGERAVPEGALLLASQQHKATQAHP